MYRLLTGVLILFSVTALADITIIDVRKNIPLSDTDPSFTDFYLAAGKSEGLKKNLVVTVFRTVNIRDASGAQSFGEIAIPVGQVKIIAVYEKVSIAREYKLLPRDVNPMLEQVGLMSGDKVELGESFVDNSTSKRKPQAIAEKIPATTTATVTTVTVIPDEFTKTADSGDTAEQTGSLPGALLENEPVNNTASPPKETPHQ